MHEYACGVDMMLGGTTFMLIASVYVHAFMNAANMLVINMNNSSHSPQINIGKT